MWGRVAVVGAGPAGWYAAQHLAKKAPIFVDLIERLPTPFGLVRYGVAPDHPEVKNVISTFNKTAAHDNVRFYGNITLGKDISLAHLRENYHAVVLAYGAERDRELNIKNEKVNNVISGRKFVGWYNGTPSDQDLKVDLSGPSVAILGQGNVAVDLARILLTPIDILRKTDITENALSMLSQSKVKNVHLIGRRGPLQVAYTTKELRELLDAPYIETVWRDGDFTGIADVVSDLARPRRRLTELMLKNIAETKKSTKSGRRFLPVFYRNPKKVLTASSGRPIGIELVVTQLAGENTPTQTCVETEQREILNCDLILRSVGYKSVQVDPEIEFDSVKGLVKNYDGRVLSHSENAVEMDGRRVDPGMYVTGWLATGPTGVILTTMSDAFRIGANIIKDFEDPRDFLRKGSSKDGFEGIRQILDRKNVQVVDWDAWTKLDAYEMELGKEAGKPREKITDIQRMLEICS